jgi:ParB/RepB/Spo0J family partition protein
MSAPAYIRVKVSQLKANARNVRKNLGDLDELTNSIRQNGILQPLVIGRPEQGIAPVIDGHRRLAAAKAAGLESVPCIVSGVAGDSATVTMLAAAMHKQLEPLELAKAFQGLLDRGLTNADIARRTGYSTSTISSRLLLLELPAEVQQQLRTHAMSIAEGVSLARQLRGGRSGTARLGQRANWFTKDHRLYGGARARCSIEHGDQRITYWGICGPCWEQEIRDDAVASEQVSA